MKLHIGSGSSALPGWVNLDIVSYPGVDAIVDVREGVPFEDVTYIFAEHFVEHLTLEEGLAFMRECRRAMRQDGIMRLSTPNLDWVWLTHYRQPDTLTDHERIVACLETNRAFHGWGHQFLYNFDTLSSALRAAGFSRVEAQTYGESAVSSLRGLERHERHADLPGVPSVIVAEASGQASESSSDFDSLVEPYMRDAAAR